MTDGVYYIGVCVAMVAATSLTRATFFVLPPRWQLPPVVDRALRFAPICALTAIIVPALFTDSNGRLVGALSNPRAWGALAAAITHLYRRSLLQMTVAGMLVFTALRLWA